MTGLTWMFLIMILSLSIAACSAVRNASSIGVDLSGVSRIAKALGLGDAKRVHDGHDPGATALVVPAQAPAPEPETAPVSAPGVGDRMRIVNTDGVGVVLRTAPREDARVPRGLPAAARVTVLARDGDQWVHVRGENGLEGWVPNQYLAPAN